MLCDYGQFSSYLLGLPCHGSIPESQSLHSLQGKWHSFAKWWVFLQGEKVPIFQEFIIISKSVALTDKCWKYQISNKVTSVFIIWSLWHHKWFIDSLLISVSADIKWILSETLILFIVTSIKYIINDWYLYRNNSIFISCNLLPGNQVWAWHEKWENEKKIPQVADAMK